MSYPATAAAIVALALLSTTASAEVYKCRIDGKTVFSDRPCSADATKIDVRPAAGRAPSAEQGGITDAPTGVPINSSTNPRALLDRMERERRVRELEYEIQRRRSKIVDEQAAMEREVATLREKKTHANNNLAGATWEKSISEEMSAVVARYDVRIRTLQDEIDRLDRDLAGLRR